MFYMRKKHIPDSRANSFASSNIDDILEGPGRLYPPPTPRYGMDAHV